MDDSAAFLDQCQEFSVLWDDRRQDLELLQHWEVVSVLGRPFARCLDVEDWRRRTGPGWLDFRGRQVILGEVHRASSSSGADQSWFRSQWACLQLELPSSASFLCLAPFLLVERTFRGSGQLTSSEVSFQLAPSQVPFEVPTDEDVAASVVAAAGEVGAAELQDVRAETLCSWVAVEPLG